MTDNILPMPPRVAMSGVAFDARLVVRDDGIVILWIPQEPFARERRMKVTPAGPYDATIALIDEDVAQHYVDPEHIVAALLWLANRGPRP